MYKIRKVGFLLGGAFTVALLAVMAPVLAYGAAPDAEDDSFQGILDMPLIISAPGVLENDSDADGDELNAVLEQPPAVGELDFETGGGFVFTPPLGFSGTVTSTYKAREVASTGSA